MSKTLPPVRPVSLADVEAARRRIAGSVMRTPLVRLEHGVAGAPEIWLKLENLQPINAYKLRGAVNAVAMIPEADRAGGVWTVSAGNAGQGVAWAARQAGVACSVVAIESAPESKLERMRALGARLVSVPYERAWTAVEVHEFEGMTGRFVHPFDDHDFIAGHATLALEIFEDLPQTATILAGVGGGGLITAIGSVAKAISPHTAVLGVEPETAAPLAASMAKGAPCAFADWQSSFVDGAGGRSVFPRMWERMKPVVDGAVVVSLTETRAAMRLMAEKARVIAEGAGALPLAAALSRKATKGPVVCVVSGGNLDLARFSELIAV